MSFIVNEITIKKNHLCKNSITIYYVQQKHLHVTAVTKFLLWNNWRGKQYYRDHHIRIVFECLDNTMILKNQHSTMLIISELGQEAIFS